ncbi:S-adenosyl-L-methionine-dependent methyltransferase [Setomelanomma holmii]|uniref:S-adenosyl-L-methionine-dependent methyltransferase n=1 Tax=Setomelanomma holmii TaxID=210430 RepID=A0A9P4HE69_9PLEO|nr:S-adenosyl-L-methionine-dependent methyltransferase [Setomelanomma holmii]
MAEHDAKEDAPDTQNTQYDQIGTKYNAIKVLPSVEPEEPSVVKALGDMKGSRCLDLACGTGKMTSLLARLGASSVLSYDISSSMIDGAKATYPPPQYPNLTFKVRDCSVPGDMKHDSPFDIVFAGWFLNYAGTEVELTNMFRVIEQNLAPDGRFVGVTTNVADPWVTQPKMDFYGLDILVLDSAYVAPDTKQKVGITARVVVKDDTPFSFDVFQFKKEVYERCAAAAGLRLTWGNLVLPDDERVTEGFWERYVERPTFSVIEAVRL